MNPIKITGSTKKRGGMHFLFGTCSLRGIWFVAPLTRYFPAWYRGSKPGSAAVLTENEKQFCTSSCRLNSRMSQKRLPPVKSCLLYMWGCHVGIFRLEPTLIPLSQLPCEIHMAIPWWQPVMAQTLRESHRRCFGVRGSRPWSLYRSTANPTRWACLLNTAQWCMVWWLQYVQCTAIPRTHACERSFLDDGWPHGKFLMMNPQSFGYLHMLVG